MNQHGARTSERFLNIPMCFWWTNASPHRTQANYYVNSVITMWGFSVQLPLWLAPADNGAEFCFHNTVGWNDYFNSRIFLHISVRDLWCKADRLARGCLFQVKDSLLTNFVWVVTGVGKPGGLLYELYRGRPFCPVIDNLTAELVLPVRHPTQ